jgi:hypothetical protein
MRSGGEPGRDIMGEDVGGCNKDNRKQEAKGKEVGKTGRAWQLTMQRNMLD